MEIIRPIVLFVSLQVVASRYTQPHPIYREEVFDRSGQNYVGAAPATVNDQYLTGLSAYDGQYRQYPVYSQSLPVQRTLQLTPENKNTKMILDQIIKDRVGALQRFQRNFNKLFDDIGNMAMSFVSQDSLFGGVSRRSLFDLSNLDAIKTINADVSELAKHAIVLYRNLVDDVKSFIHYVTSRPHFGLEELLGNAFSGISGVLRLLT